MKKLNLAILLSILMFICVSSAEAQGPKNKDLGFGLILGDPTGATLKYWTSRENAFDFYLGSSYFGELRIGGDYLWHFNAFNSRVVKLYAGAGASVGIGSGNGVFYDNNKDKWKDGDDLGIAVRGIFGLNFIPRNTPFEIFLELGPLVALTPISGMHIEGALGFRFYP